MADPTFFKKSGAKTLAQILEVSGATLVSDTADQNMVLDDVVALTDAKETHVSFFDNVKYKEQLKTTKAGACFVHPDALKFLPETVVGLVSKSPYKAYALTAQYFYPQVKSQGNISERATIDTSARLSDNVTIDAGAVIGKNVVIGDGTWIEANAVIGDGVKIGENCRIGAGATVSHTIIKDHVRIYTGGRIGQDGFGFAIDPAGHVKVPQLGRVIIHDRCEIGANTTIDRGAGPDTVIGQGTWIDNLVQIAHNVKIGRGCVIVAQVGISGSTEIGDFTVIAGQVGIAGHLKIGSGVQVAAQSGVMRDIPDGDIQMGSPAKPIKENMKQIAYLNKIVR